MLFLWLFVMGLGNHLSVTLWLYFIKLFIIIGKYRMWVLFYITYNFNKQTIFKRFLIKVYEDFLLGFLLAISILKWDLKNKSKYKK